MVIAGGGVAAIEALLAVREQLDGFVSVDLVSPTDEFVYRPLVVAEPFGLTERKCFDLEDIAADHSAHLHVDALRAVDAGRRCVTLSGGTTLPYDALIVAIGAEPASWLDGAIDFRGPVDVEPVRRLLSELDSGEVNSVAFVAPPSACWTLPLYELALLTAARLGEGPRAGARLAVITPEESPLAAFGPGAARHVRGLCADRGIELRTATTAASFAHGRLELDPHGSLEAERVVALPELRGRVVPGLPHDRDGFLRVDDHCAVDGLEGVYGAGDGIAYPIKQGGLASQQADVAAQGVAVDLGFAEEAATFSPLLRGQLLTGLGPVYLRASAQEGRADADAVAINPLWWPPSKIAGRYLAPYLARRAVPIGARELEEREPAGSQSHEAHTEARKLALTFADHDAGCGDYRSALAWLETLEQIDGVLSPMLIARRTAWRDAAR